MSWDVMAFACEVPPPPVDRMPQDWHPDVMGSGDEVRSRISEYLTGVDWSDPTWGIYWGDGFTFEFSVGTEEPKEHFTIHVRGGGEALAALMKFAIPNGWYLLDCSTSEWLDPENPSEAGWKGFQGYRDRVIDQYRDLP